MGGRYANQGVLYGVTRWQFEGQEIFKRAVHGMGEACEAALKKIGVDARIRSISSCRIKPICASSKLWPSAAHVPMERVFVNVQRYGNMSSATVPVALCEALEENRVKPGALLLMPGFGGGLTYCAHLVRWGERVKPLGTSNAELPPNDRTALELDSRRDRAQVTPGEHRRFLSEAAAYGPDAAQAWPCGLYFLTLFVSALAAAAFFLAGSFGRDLPNEPL